MRITVLRLTPVLFLTAIGSRLPVPVARYGLIGATALLLAAAVVKVTRATWAPS